MTKAYRAYLHEVEVEGRRSLAIFGWGLALISLVHPFLALLAIPTMTAAWLTLYRRARLQFIGTLYRSEVLLRALRFDDYDPELLRTMELGRMEGAPPLRMSKLEAFWQSFDASCRSFGRHAVEGTHWLWWMALPLAAMTLGLIALPGLRHSWNWLPLTEPARSAFLDAAIFIVAWLVGVGAAILCKMVIQLALVVSAWDAVIAMADQPEEDKPGEGQAVRESIISWRMPTEADNPARNGMPRP